MFYYTYVLCCRDGKLYIGSSGDLQRRVAEHKAGLVPATRHRLPIRLVYFEACTNKQGAIRQECYFKTGFGRKFLKARIVSTE